MPRTRLQSHIEELKVPLVPPPNYVAELFRRYSKAQQITTDNIGAALGISGAAVRYALNRPVRAWKVEDLQKYCSILHVPLSDAFQAAADSIKGCRK